MYDGECNLCNRTVNFIQGKDKSNLFIAIPIQSDEGNKYARRLGIQNSNPNSVVLIEDSVSKDKSSAGIRILELLNGTRWIAIILGLFPEKFNDTLYDFIARHRVSIFGKRALTKAK